MFTGGTYGGGGGGGRIAIYHKLQNHFTGEYLVFGGKGPYQYGGSGTVYIEDHSGNATFRHLRLDNSGNTASNRISEVERLNLTGNYFKTSKFPDKYFQTYSGINISSDVNPETYNAYSSYYWYYFRNTWPLSHMFTDIQADTSTWFMARASQATLTFDLPFKTYVEYIKIYPVCTTKLHIDLTVCSFFRLIS
ncbi:hypothetical protein DPMN_117922 [Dreissena polymorpha]|uniref:Uncharacterized protein n=1 Tax=Dreissena polymorpha TaxID=45954 RepID=A0A9D4GFJ4_DREPO|nr:hypothetical protein DPMN_117922 [Dreissena polymorpha]